MNSTNKLLILLTLCGISYQDNICQTKECKQTANYILKSIDKEVDPCDDFYKYTCGNWNPQDLKNALIFPFTIANMLQNTSTSSEPKYIHPLINFYKGCVNTKIRDSHESNDLKEIQTLIKRVGGWPIIDDDWDEHKYDVEQAIIELNKIMMAKIIVDIEVFFDMSNSSRNIISIINPSKPMTWNFKGIHEVFPKNPNIPDPREGVKDYADDYYTENPYLSIAEALKGKAIDSHQFSRDMNDSQQLDMKMKRIEVSANKISYLGKHYEEYKIKAKDLDNYHGLNYRKIINGILKAEGTQLNDNDTLFVDKEYLTGLGHIMTTANKRAIANMIGLNIATSFSQFTSSKMMNLTGGIPKGITLPQVCESLASQFLPDLLNRFYLDNTSAKDSIEDMKALIESLKEAFNELLNENKWLDSTTKTNALKKLNAITPYIAFPEYIFNDTLLSDYHKKFANFSENAFLSTMITGLAQQRAVNTRSLRNPNPVGHWPVGLNDATQINAFYYPWLNGIFFPSGIAQFPFYQNNRPRTVNLGTIGMIIGHEMTHGFDIIGSLFDLKGNLNNWFTDKSRTVFTEKAECFVGQYNKFKYNISGSEVSINGRRTLAENSADNGGLRVAYRAMQLYKSKNAGKMQKLPGALANLSDEMLYFLSFTNSWCFKMQGDALKNYLELETHSPSDARALGSLVNFPEFAKAFNCKAGTRMNPINKCVLWG